MGELMEHDVSQKMGRAEQQGRIERDRSLPRAATPLGQHVLATHRPDLGTEGFPVDLRDEGLEEGQLCLTEQRPEEPVERSHRRARSFRDFPSIRRMFRACLGAWNHGEVAGESRHRLQQ